MGVSRLRRGTRRNITTEAPRLDNERGSSQETDTFSWSGSDVIHDEDKPTQPSIAKLSDMRDVDPQAAALERSLTLPLRGQPYDVSAREGDRGEADEIREILTTPATNGGMTTPLNDIIAQMTTAVVLKRAFYEKVWKYEDGRYMYHKLAFRPAKNCSIRQDKNGSFNGYAQKVTRDQREVEEKFDPEYAFVFFRGGNRSFLKGESAFNAAWHAFEDKRQIMKIWREHLQDFSLGMVVGTHPKNATKDKIRAFFNKLKRARGGSRMVKHPDENVEVIKSASSTGEYKEALQYLDTQMAVSVLAQFLNLGQGENTGAWTLSRDHSDFFLQALQADLDEMAASITNHVIAPLVFYNFGPDASYPEFVFQPLAETDRNRAYEFYKDLINVADHNIDHIDQPTIEAIKRKALETMDIKVDYSNVAPRAEGEEGIDPNPPPDERTAGPLDKQALDKAGVPQANPKPALGNGGADFEKSLQALGKILGKQAG